jgi:hypothetical protein
LVFSFAVFCAVRTKSVTNANIFVQSIGESPKLIPNVTGTGGTIGKGTIGNDAKAKLLSDANLSSSRYELPTGFLQHPNVTLMPRSLADHLLMRSTYRVEFKTLDKNRKKSPAVGDKLFHNRHESDYQTGVFGVAFLGSTTNPR